MTSKAISKALIRSSLFALTLALAGCATMPGASSGSSSAPSTASTTPSAAPAQLKIGPDMNQAGEVIDPKKGELVLGRTLKGLNDWEGEITGMPMRQVMDILGASTDQGAYVTGQAFIPFFFGSDRYRHELANKGQSHLIVAGTSGMGTSAYLNWIIHSADETA